MSTVSGRAFVFGHDVDTDALAPGAYLKAPIEEVARHCLESLDPGFATSVSPGDVVVAGRNFGAGSSREQAAAALRSLGVAAVVAQSFAGIFYRNAINLGLPAVVCAEADRIVAGARVEHVVGSGVVQLPDRGITLHCDAIPAHLMNILDAGGLLRWLEQRAVTQRTSIARSSQAPQHSLPKTTR